MFLNHQQSSTEKIEKFADLLDHAQHTYAITGAGISTNAGIPDLQHLPGMTGMSLSSESSLERDPKAFYQGFHQIFIDPIFQHGPTPSHYALARLAEVGKLDGIVTTNVDYLHELAGSQQVADVWHSLNVNYCLQCGKVYDINILNQPVPTCPACGGLISPGPVYHHIGIDNVAYQEANRWMDQADLVIVIGSNGYYSNVSPAATVVNINNALNDFDSRANLVIRDDSDHAMSQLIDLVAS